MGWSTKSKTDESGDWSDKTKIPATLQRGRLLTPDGNQILVGESLDKILIYQAYSENWSKKSKTDDSEDWNVKSKTDDSGDWVKKSKITGSWTEKTKISN